jgi:hypothetical protein
MGILKKVMFAEASLSPSLSLSQLKLELRALSLLGRLSPTLRSISFQGSGSQISISKEEGCLNTRLPHNKYRKEGAWHVSFFF